MSNNNYRPLEPLGASKSFICKEAARLSTNYNLVNSDIFDVVEKLNGVALHTPSNEANNPASLIVNGDSTENRANKFEIYIDKKSSFNDPKYGIRYAVAHELGHYVLHYHLYNRYTTKGGMLNANIVRRDQSDIDNLDKQGIIALFNGSEPAASYSDEDMKNLLSKQEGSCPIDKLNEKEKGLLIEFEADGFAMSFLLPKPFFCKYWDGLIKDEDNEFVEFIESSRTSYKEKLDIIRKSKVFNEKYKDVLKASSRRVLNRALCLDLIKLPD